MTQLDLQSAIRNANEFTIEYKPEQKVIEEIAFKLWQEEHKPQGNDLYYWYKAEELLRNCFWQYFTDDLIEAIQGSK